MFPIANVPHVFHKYVLYNAKIVDKQKKKGKNEDYNYICYNIYLHYQNVVSKKYGRKEIICKDIARSIRFFVMGFCDIAYQASFRKALCGWHTTYNETEEQHEGSIDVRIRQTASQEEGYNRDVNDELKNMRVCQNRHILFSYQIQFGSLSMQPFPASAILKTPNSSHKLFLSVCFPYKFGQGVA